MSNAHIAEQLFDAFNNSDWDTARKYAGTDLSYQEMATGRVTQGVEGWIENSKGWQAAFSNAKGTLVNRFEVDDKVVEEVVWSGTHDGDLVTPDGQTIPPTNKSMETPAIMINTFKDGQLVAVNHYFDMMSMMAQLGLLG